MVKPDALTTLKRALANLAMRRALITYAAASLAEYAAYFTVILIAFDRGGASAAGFAAAIQLAPSVLVPVIIRVVAPRVTNPMRWSLMWMAAVLVTGVMVASAAPLWAVVALAAMRAIGYSLARPIHLAVVPVHSDSAAELTAAMVVTGWIDAGGAIAGPALAALFLGFVDSPGVFAVAAALTLIGAVVSPGAGVSVPSRGGSSGRVSVFDIEGAKPLFAYKSVSAMLSGATDVIIVLVALQLLGLGDEGAGYMASLLGVGELIGSVFLVSLIGRKGLTGLLGVSALGRGATLSLLGAVPQAVPLIAIGGGFRPTHRVVQRLLLQRITPPDRYMQMFGVNEAFDATGQAVGAAMVPLLVAAFGLQTSVVIAGAILPIAFMTLIRVFSSIDHRSVVPQGVIDVLDDAPWLTGMPDDVIEYLARVGVVEEVEAGTHLIQRGDAEADCAWVILSGEFEVHRDGIKLATLSRADLVGEMSLIHDEPRNADVVATSASSVLRIDRGTFLDVLVGGRGGGERIEAVAAERSGINRTHSGVQ